MLTVESLNVRLGRKKVLSDVSFSAGEGLTMLIGPNGSGKSTLIRSILGSIPHESGCVWLNGCSLDTLSVRQRARMLAYLPQFQTIPPRVSVVDYVAMGSCPEFGIFSSIPETAYRRARMILEELQADSLKNCCLDELSGGEKRLAALARALMQENAYLLMDEPLAGLDFGKQQEFLSMLRRRKVSGLMSVHDPAPAWQYGDRVLVMKNGRISELPPNDDAAFINAIRQLYGIEITLPRSERGRQA